MEPYRRELDVHCYRMLGSVDDADEVLQETLVAAWLGLGGFAGRPPVAPIAPFEPPRPSSRVEVTWLQPSPDGALDELDPSVRVVVPEGVELAFITALQTLAPRQAAALVLCDVLGFSQAESGEMLDAAPTAVKGLLQRARAATPQRTPAALPEAEARLAREFAEAFTVDDVEGTVNLLTDKAWLAIPPATERYEGPEAIAAFLRASATARLGGSYRLLPTRGRPAFGCCLQGLARGILVLTPIPDGSKIVGITRFLDNALHRHFGLPDTLP